LLHWTTGACHPLSSTQRHNTGETHRLRHAQQEQRIHAAASEHRLIWKGLKTPTPAQCHCTLAPRPLPSSHTCTAGTAVVALASHAAFKQQSALPACQPASLPACQLAHTTEELETAALVHLAKHPSPRNPGSMNHTICTTSTHTDSPRLLRASHPQSTDTGTHTARKAVPCLNLAALYT
jgi:hypothetical protein